MSTSDARVLQMARDGVKRVLTASDAFAAMPAEEKRALANGMVKIASYIAAGERGDTPPIAAQLAGTDRALLVTPPTASGDIKRSGAAAAEAGVDALAEAVQKVDFPEFVAGLIDGVFNAIVNSSIKQMQAYSELVQNVAKSVDQYMKDNVTENQARDYLVDKYPDHIELDLTGAQPMAKPKQGADEASMPDFFKDLGLPGPVTSVSDETVEQELVPAARKRLAMDRQQLLLTMVLMGVNRLVVTDGSIKASVVFELDTKDKAHRDRKSTATNFSQENVKSSTKPGFFAWFKPHTSSERTAKFTTHTVNTNNATSDSSVELRTRLAGDVNLRFKSETFPLEKMADLIGPDLRAQIESKRAAPTQPAAPGLAPPALPPLPPLPAISAPPAPGSRPR